MFVFASPVMNISTDSSEHFLSLFVTLKILSSPLNSVS